MLTEKKNRKGVVYYENEHGDIVAKICTKCNEVKTLNNYAVLKIGLGGRVSDCKDCRVRDYQNNRRREIERVSKWQRENPDKVNMREHRRRARKKGLPDTITDMQYESTVEYFGGCALTGAIIDLQSDHVIPLATGYVGTVYENMVPLRSDLTKSKNDANIFEWFERNKKRLNLEQERFDRLIEWLAKVSGVTVEQYRFIVYWCFDKSNEIGNYSNDIQTA